MKRWPPLSALGTAFCVALIVTLVPPPFAAATTWPASMKAQLLRWPGPPLRKPVPYGRVLAPAAKDTDVSKQHRAVFVGADGWALGDVDEFEYPEFTMNHGRTWRIGGVYFASPTQDGGAFTDVIKAFSASVAVSFLPGQQALYVTSDTGRRWYATTTTSDILGVSEVTTPSGQPALNVTLSGYPNAKNVLRYQSTNFGKSWNRIVQSAP